MLKIGDRVRFKKDDDSFLEDLQFDLQATLDDGDMTGKEFGTLYDAITEDRIFKVQGREKQPSGSFWYSIAIGKVEFPFAFEEERFEVIK